jgi:hypothetical protein
MWACLEASEAIGSVLRPFSHAAMTDCLRPLDVPLPSCTRPLGCLWGPSSPPDAVPDGLETPPRHRYLTSVLPSLAGPG